MEGLAIFVSDRQHISDTFVMFFLLISYWSNPPYTLHMARSSSVYVDVHKGVYVYLWMSTLLLVYFHKKIWVHLSLHVARVIFIKKTLSQSNHSMGIFCEQEVIISYKIQHVFVRKDCYIYKECFDKLLL